jgi:hypothetical protein
MGGTRLERDVGALPHLAEAVGRGPVFLDGGLQRGVASLRAALHRNALETRSQTATPGPGDGAGCYMLRPRLAPGLVTVAGVDAGFDT